MVQHKPVLVNEILSFIKPEYETILDGTLGHGGHAKHILTKFSNIKKYIWVDRDKQILSKAQSNLTMFKDKIIFINTSYDNLEDIAKQSWIDKFDLMLLDLGVNMEHFKDWQRGFSIKQEGPLDMRFDINQDFDAKKLLHIYSKQKLIEILQKYGDFSSNLASKIAQAIIDARNKQPLATTLEFKNLLKSLGLSDKKIAVVFQVLRIEVNQELAKLENFLDKFTKWLKSGWRCLIISYHSIEDRIVKNKFKQLSKEWKLQILTKHTVKPSWQEIKSNKAARSAQLRVGELIDREDKGEAKK